HQQGIDGFVDAQMGDLTGSVNAGVGAAGAADVGLAEHVARSFQQPPLNRFRRVTLRLPTGVASSLVLDGQLIRRHIFRMRPKSWQVLGNELVVIWDDGHESYYPLEKLRRACPCAGCSGEPDLFGRMAMGPKPHYTPLAFELSSVTPIGNYALQPNWADG